MEKRKPQCSIGRNVSGYSHYGIYDGGFSKIKNRTTIWNNNLTSGYISKRLESRILRYFTPMFIEVLCTKTKRSKQSTPSLDEKMNEVWYIHTMEYYSAFKRKEILSCATIWMKLEDVILGEISCLKKTNSLWLYLDDIFNIGKFMKVEW